MILDYDRVLNGKSYSLPILELTKRIYQWKDCAEVDDDDYNQFLTDNNIRCYAKANYEEDIEDNQMGWFVERNYGYIDGPFEKYDLLSGYNAYFNLTDELESEYYKDFLLNNDFFESALQVAVFRVNFFNPTKNVIFHFMIILDYSQTGSVTSKINLYQVDRNSPKGLLLAFYIIAIVCCVFILVIGFYSMSSGRKKEKKKENPNPSALRKRRILERLKMFFVRLFNFIKGFVTVEAKYLVFDLGFCYFLLLRSRVQSLGMSLVVVALILFSVIYKFAISIEFSKLEILFDEWVEVMPMVQKEEFINNFNIFVITLMMITLLSYYQQLPGFVGDTSNAILKVFSNSTLFLFLFFLLIFTISVILWDAFYIYTNDFSEITKTMISLITYLLGRGYLSQFDSYFERDNASALEYSVGGYFFFTLVTSTPLFFDFAVSFIDHLLLRHHRRSFPGWKCCWPDTGGSRANPS